MTDERDMPRWTAPGSEVPHELRQLISESRNQVGTPDQVAALSQQLAGILGPGASLPVPPPLPLPAPSRLASRWVAGLVGGTNTVVALLSLWRDPTPMEAPAPPPPSPLSTPEIAPPAPSVAAPPSATLETAPAVEPEAPAAPAKPSPGANRTREPARTTSPGAEAALLEKARAALPARPAEALRIAQEHARSFKRGILTEEREVIAIQALRQLGRKAEADQRAAQFERKYRGSVHQNKIGDRAQ
jgi:hypothetical protein